VTSAAYQRGAGASPDRASRPGPLWVLPAALFFAAFAVAPLILVVVLSFASWNGVASPKLTGAGNWTRLLSDGTVASSLKLSVVLTVLAWAVQTALALPLGVWAAGRQRNRALLSSIFMIPLLLSSVAIALIFLQLLDPNFGLPAWLGPKLGFSPNAILGSGAGAMGAVVFVVSWQFIPFHLLLYQAGARQIPQMLYDAAVIDGAGRAQQFFRVTLPQLRHTIVTSSVLIVVGSLTYFDTVLVLTQGGPGTSTDILPYHMYESGFKAYEMGYASAIAVGLVVIGSAVSLLIVRFSGFASMRSTLEGV
jgi:xylobiose transport system permease protein